MNAAESHTNEVVNLEILGAVYGLLKVTNTLIPLVDRNSHPQSLSVVASNEVFGDGWPGMHKCLTVFFRYGPNGPVRTATAVEGDRLVVGGPRAHATDADVVHDSTGGPHLSVLGATYGPGNVLEKTLSLINQPAQSLSLVANNETFSDSWPGYRKTFVILAAYTDQVPFVDVVIEGAPYGLHYRPPLQVYSAYYGLKDVTSVVRGSVMRRALELTANNATFGDGWFGHHKTLQVVYQYGEQQPQLAIAQEGFVLSVDYNSTIQPYRRAANPKVLNVVRAAYGRIDVTDEVIALVKNERLAFAATNATFGRDGWPGVQKSFSMTYSWGSSAISSLVVAEDMQVQVSEPTVLWNQSFIALDGLYNHGDLAAFQASNGDFWTVSSDGKITASADAQADAMPFIICLPAAAAGAIQLQAPDRSYVMVGPDGLLRTGGTASSAANIIPAAMSSGSIVLSVAGLAGPAFVSLLDDGTIKAGGSRVSTFSTSFSMLLKATAAGDESYLLATKLQGAQDIPFDPLLAQCVYDLTIGLFAAMGLGPLLNQGVSRTGLLNLVYSNPKVAAGLNSLLAQVQSNPQASLTGTFLGFLGLLHSEWMLWKVLRFALDQAKWRAIGWVMTKVLEFTLLPELAAAELAVSLSVWAYRTTEDMLAYNNSLNGSKMKSMIDLQPTAG